MTQVAIQKQIDVIKKVNSEVGKSPETALKFLTNVGVIKDKSITKVETKKKK
ncbi:MAG: hypothetical protein ABI863_00565 [Ginsengibacter sp.]